METKIEYRVRPVTRYIVTRYEAQSDGVVETDGGSTQHGEFDDFNTAYAVGYALAKAEHDRLGWPLDDPRMKYPESAADLDAHQAELAVGAVRQSGMRLT
jgi:hypothetical protein